MNSNLLQILDNYIGNDISRCIEDLLIKFINLPVVVVVLVLVLAGVLVLVLTLVFNLTKPDILELCELEAPAQDGIDLNFSLVLVSAKHC